MPPSPPSPSPSPSLSSSPLPTAQQAAPLASAPPVAAVSLTPKAPHVSPKRALAVLFLDGAPEAAAACLREQTRTKAVECMLTIRYGNDTLALADALAIYRTAEWVAGLEHAREMNGGWRGMLQLTPELPVARYRRHLKYLRYAAEEMHRFFAAHAKEATTAPQYRWQALELRFFRSVGRTTPSAYAHNWSVAYNVSGSLHKSANAVRETMFHEIFHLNDAGWSAKTLQPIYAAIVKRCRRRSGKLSTPCLRAYAPHHTMVRGGTYYAFEPGNGVGEYAAELALRYNREHRAQWLGAAPKAAFKCKNSDNARAWKAIVDALFAGVDAVPPCLKSPPAP